MRYFAKRIPAALITFVVGVALSGAAGQLFATGPADERAVLAVEREYLRAHLERDVRALDRVLAEDFSMFGGRVKKEHRLALISNPVFRVTSLQTDDVTVVVVSKREALLTGTAKMSGSFRGREFTTPRYGFTRRYEKRGDRWQVVSCEFSLPW